MAVGVTESGYDFGKWINTMETAVVVVANKTSVEMATRLRDRVVQNIFEQTLPLTPLNDKYKLYKAKNGLDTRILIATGQYVDAIEVWKWKRGDILTVQVGVRPNRIHKKLVTGGHKKDAKKGKTKRLRMVDLARMLEVGTKNMPARPAWFLSMEQLLNDLKTFNDWYARQVRKQVARDVRRYKMREKRIA